MEKTVHRIHPPRGFSLGLRELWHYRELFYFFTWRDIKVKYKQTYLGVLWALLQPLGLMVIFTLLFTRTWKIDTTPVDYPIFVLSGLILWNLFHSSVSQAGESMIQHASIIKKIYFPRLIIPGSAVLVSFFDFLMGLIIFFIFCMVYRQPVHWSGLWLFPAGIAVLGIAGFGAGVFLAALNVKYRDFRYTIPFLLQFLFFSSQVIYPLRNIQQEWLRYLLSLNPVNAAIELFRAPLTGGLPDPLIVWTGLTCALFILVSGIYYFRKTESYFADLA